MRIKDFWGLLDVVLAFLMLLFSLVLIIVGELAVGMIVYAMTIIIVCWLVYQSQQEEK